MSVRHSMPDRDKVAEQAASRVRSNRPFRPTAGFDGAGQPSALLRSLDILTLQRHVGNRVVAHLLAGSGSKPENHTRVSVPRVPPVQRAVAWDDGPRVRTSSVLTAITALTPFAVTPSRVNLEEFPGGNAAQAVFPPQIEVENALLGKKAKVVGNDVINVIGYRMELPVAPPWQGPVDSATVASAIGFHTDPGRNFAAERGPYADHPGNTNLIVQGMPSNDVFSSLVEQHENHHVEEVRSTMQNHLVPWDANIARMRREGETTWGLDAQSATANLYREAGGAPAEVGNKLEREFRRLGEEYHAAAEGKPPTIISIGTTPDCSSITVFLKHPMG